MSRKKRKKYNELFGYRGKKTRKEERVKGYNANVILCICALW